jgi:FtsH-binding integral membrane protein
MVAEPGVVLLATCITSFLVISLGCYAANSSNDITQKVNFFIYGPIILIVLIIVGSFFRSYLVDTIISLLIIGFFSIYLVFDL